MNEEPEIEPYYQNQAKDFVDTLFNNGYFDRDVKRKDMRDVENLLAYLLQSGAESARKVAEILRKVR